MYHLFLFLFMRAVIHALPCSSLFSSRCTHSCAVFVHALHSFMHCIHSYAVFIDSSHSCIHSFLALMHALFSILCCTHSLCIKFIYALIHALYSFIHVAITPHTACIHALSFGMVLLPFMYHIHVSNIQHLIERYEQISYITPNFHMVARYLV